MKKEGEVSPVKKNDDTHRSRKKKDKPPQTQAEKPIKESRSKRAKERQSRNTVNNDDGSSNKTSGVGLGIKKGGIANTNLRLDKIEKYLQDRFNWLNLPIEKKSPSNVSQKKFSMNISPQR